MNILQKDEESGIVMASPANQLMAFGECAALATMTAEYGRMPMHMFHDRFMCAAEHTQILMFYQTDDEGGPAVPVGFFWLGWLNPATERLYLARNRELSPIECNTGKCLWVMENCSPLGHFAIMKKLLMKNNQDCVEVYGIVKGKRVIFKNEYCNLKEE